MITELFQKGRNKNHRITDKPFKKPFEILLDAFWMLDYPTLPVTQGEHFLFNANAHFTR